MNSMRTLLFLNTLPLVRRASAWSDNILDLAFSAFFLWMNSMRTLLFLNTLPLAFRYNSWYRWRSIFLASLYLFSTLLAGPGILGTLPLSKPTVTTLATGFIISADTGPRVNSDRLLDDKTILNQLPDVLPGVGISDLIDLIGVKPDLVFATFHDICREALLELERTHSKGSRLDLSCRSESSNISLV